MSDLRPVSLEEQARMSYVASVAWQAAYYAEANRVIDLMQEVERRRTQAVESVVAFREKDEHIHMLMQEDEDAEGQYPGIDWEAAAAEYVKRIDELTKENDRLREPSELNPKAVTLIDWRKVAVDNGVERDKLLETLSETVQARDYWEKVADARISQIEALKEERDEWEGRARDFARRILVTVEQETSSGQVRELKLLVHNVQREVEEWEA